MKNKQKHCRILSIDGGGIRGIIPGVVLTFLEAKLQKISGNNDARLADYFDLMAGTSTGGILSCCYLLPDDKKKNKSKFSAEEVVNLYFEHGEDIFDRPFFHKVQSGGGLFDEKYPNRGFKETLKKYMGNTWLSELIKPTLITAYDVERRKTHFFTQHDAQKKGNDFLIKDVALSTAAAPTYFEATLIDDDLKRKYAFIDGGVFANNPTLCAYAEARNLFKKAERNKGVTAEDMYILSIGTGYAKETYPHLKVRNWGQAQWIKPLIDIMMTGVSETVDYQIRQIYDAIEKPANYLRMDAPLPEFVSTEMDNAGKQNMAALHRQGQLLVEKFETELQAFAEKIINADACERIA